MISKYVYNGQTYRSESLVRQAIWEKERRVFIKEPDTNKVDFWVKFGVAYTEEPDPELPPAVLAEREILVLKAKLRNTDYAVIKIAEGAATVEEYADVIAQRNTWRSRINELEAVLNGESNVQ